MTKVTLAGLAAAIETNPYDALLRGVYADALAEQGQGELEAYHRVVRAWLLFGGSDNDAMMGEVAEFHAGLLVRQPCPPRLCEGVSWGTNHPPAGVLVSVSLAKKLADGGVIVNYQTGGARNSGPGWASGIMHSPSRRLRRELYSVHETTPFYYYGPESAGEASVKMSFGHTFYEFDFRYYRSGSWHCVSQSRGPIGSPPDNS